MKKAAISNTDRLNRIIATQEKLACATFDLNHFMNLAIKEMRHLTPATGAVIELLEGDEVVYSAVNGTVKKYLGFRMPIAGSISGLCIAKAKVMRSNDTNKDHRVNKEACKRVKARSLIVVPLCNKAKVVGVLKVLSRFPSAFNAIDIQTLKLMAGLIGSALAHQIFNEERAKLIAELQEAQKNLMHLAHFDYLTELPNRILFHDRLESAMHRAHRSQKFAALMYLDIDFFKSINDTYGHSIGDELLKKFALRLKHCIRKTDTVSRLGGDEFAIILDGIKEPQDAELVANKIIDAMRKEFKLGKENLNITTSVGVAIYHCNHQSADDFLKEADFALYQAKEKGRNTFQVFRPKA